MPLNADDIERLYRDHARAMVTYFVRRTLDAEAAVDLVAETFAVAIAQRERCRAGDAEGRAAWVYGIARNHLHAWYRSGAIERRALSRVGIERPTLSDTDIDRIDELGGTGEVRARVAALLAELGPEMRRAVQLRIVEERSYADVAGQLGVSEQTARMRVSRGLRALGDGLDDHVECSKEASRGG